MTHRRGFLKRLLALLGLLLPPAAALAREEGALHVRDGWVLTERDLAEIARLDR